MHPVYAIYTIHGTVQEILKRMIKVLTANRAWQVSTVELVSRSLYSAPTAMNRADRQSHCPRDLILKDTEKLKRQVENSVQ